MNEIGLPKMEHKDLTKFWIKEVGFGNENWAVYEEVDGKYVLYFFDASKAVFDNLTYPTEILLLKELQYNGFERYEREAVPVQEPEGDWTVSEQAHRRIYSGGKFWKRLPERLREKYGEALE